MPCGSQAKRHALQLMLMSTAKPHNLGAGTMGAPLMQCYIHVRTSISKFCMHQLV